MGVADRRTTSPVREHREHFPRYEFERPVRRRLRGRGFVGRHPNVCSIRGTAGGMKRRGERNSPRAHGGHPPADAPSSSGAASEARSRAGIHRSSSVAILDILVSRPPTSAGPGQDVGLASPFDARRGPLPPAAAACRHSVQREVRRSVLAGSRIRMSRLPWPVPRTGHAFWSCSRALELHRPEQDSQ